MIGGGVVDRAFSALERFVDVALDRKIAADVLRAGSRLNGLHILFWRLHPS